MWYIKYLGRAYSESFDCMQLAMDVGKEFGHKVEKPIYIANVFDQARAVKVDKDSVCRKISINEVKDGDPVLFLCRDRFYHIGVYVKSGDSDYVLHADQKAGMVVITRLTQMSVLGYELEGYYRWID